MSLNIIDARMVNKILTGGTPSIAPSSDHTDGTWIDTDTYISEIVLNTTDEKVWIMGENGPLELAVTTGATSGVFVSGGGTINRLTKFVGSTDVGDSLISETSGVVTILSNGNSATPALTLNDTSVGFFGGTGSLSVTVNGQENIRFSDNQVDIVDDLEVGLSTTTTGIATPPISITASATIENYQSFVRVLTAGSNITLTLPSPAGSTPTPRDGQILTVFRQGDATSNVFLRTNFQNGIIRSGSALTADSIRIPAIEQNVCLTIQYIDVIGKWIVVSVSPDVSIAYESVI
jgi:hypothetical protein